jgi:hypothetical protein
MADEIGHLQPQIQEIAPQRLDRLAVSFGNVAYCRVEVEGANTRSDAALRLIAAETEWGKVSRSDLA